MKTVSKIVIAISLVFGLAACDNMSRDTGTASAPAASAASVPVAASQASAPVEAKAELDLNNFDITEHLGDREMGFKVAQLCKQEGPDNATGEYKSKACNEIFNDLNSPCNLDAAEH
nr:MAG TPA: lipoprotein [Caudoviricetes sp.]